MQISYNNVLNGRQWQGTTTSCFPVFSVSYCNVTPAFEHISYNNNEIEEGCRERQENRIKKRAA